MNYIGVDLGKKMDPTAVALVETQDAHPVYGTQGVGGFDVSGLERVPLGTPYVEVVERLAALTSRPALVGRCVVVVDGTGVGAPVVESMRRRLSCEVAAVTMTSGEKGSQKGHDYTVPKQDLMAGLQVLLEQGALRIVRELPEAGALVKELMNVRSRSRESGRPRIGADRFGEHDDLVIAVALAVWRAKRQRWNSLGSGRLPGF